MDMREERGKVIATTLKIRQKGSLWIVPSQEGKDTYTVDVNCDSPHCTCPDHEMRHAKCKHIYAIEYFQMQVSHPDGTTTITKTVRVTYKQDWKSYNLAQTRETAHFVDLLHGLCAGIIQPVHTGAGRPRLPLADVVFSSVFKVYTTMSGRRASSEIAECQSKGYLSELPSYNSLFRYLEDAALTPLLTLLIEESASPLAEVETTFAVDSSGFSTSKFARWYDAKYGRVLSERQWLKMHLVCGVQTHIVTSVRMTEGYASDSTELPGLLAATCDRFSVEEVVADKGYISAKNLQVITDMDATPYIPFKKNTTGQGSALWRKMYGYFLFHREEFLQHYHKRSNVESVFSMIKMKFGDNLRSKTEVAQQNEALCKVLCHNLYILIQAMYELGIEPVFWTQEEHEQIAS